MVKNRSHFLQNVSVSVAKDNIVTVKGPKGTLTRWVNPDIAINLDGSELVLERPTEQKRHKALHGLYRSLINNMVVGVSNGFKIDLEIVGVGYKAAINNGILELNLGFSHAIFMVVPEEIKVATLSEKGQNPKVLLEGIDKELLGQVQQN